MATRVIDDDKLNDIAVAIQSKDSGGQMTVDEMPERIENIPSGGGTLIPKTITENGVYNASSDNADGYDVVTVNVPEKNTFDEYFADTLEVANIPSATSLSVDFFKNKNNLKYVNVQNVLNIPANCFSFCFKLETVILSKSLTSIANYGFYNCEKLVLTSLPKTITNIGNYVFVACRSIPYLDMSEIETIPTLGRDSFLNTTFPFYFADQTQLDEYAIATNWSTYADRFQIKPSGVI